MALPDPVIHLYWAYALVRAKEMFKVTLSPRASVGRKPNASTSAWTRGESPARFAENERRRGTPAKRRDDPPSGGLGLCALAFLGLTPIYRKGIYA